MTSSPYFGLLLTFVCYYIGLIVKDKINHTLANPLLVALILISTILVVFDIPYENYMVGGDYILIFMGPATVALVVPLYKNIDVLKKNLVPILVGITVGSITAIVSILVLVKVLGLNKPLAISLIPKSITTAIAMPLSDAMGGIGILTAGFVAIRGVIGTLFGPRILKSMKIVDPVATGIALGTTSHAFGTTKAIELGEIEGSMSGLSIAIAGIITAIIAPVVVLKFL